jgi:hypothetical protein
MPAFTRPARHAVVRQIADHPSIPSKFRSTPTDTGSPPGVALKCDISPIATVPAPVSGAANAGIQHFFD